jgi:hypothetical protein
MRLRRATTVRELTLTAEVGTTPAVSMADFAGGTIVVPAGVTLGAVAFHGSTDGVNFVPAADEAGTAITKTYGAGTGHPLPEALFGWPWLKVTAANGGAVRLALKG